MHRSGAGIPGAAVVESAAAITGPPNRQKRDPTYDALAAALWAQGNWRGDDEYSVNLGRKWFAIAPGCWLFCC
jgi:hypothetical protein